MAVASFIWNKILLAYRETKAGNKDIKQMHLLCFISWTASVGQLEHIKENMRTTMMNIPELRIGGVTTRSCWIFVSKSLEATCWSKFFNKKKKIVIFR